MALLKLSVCFSASDRSKFRGTLFIGKLSEGECSTTGSLITNISLFGNRFALAGHFRKRRSAIEKRWQLIRGMARNSRRRGRNSTKPGVVRQAKDGSFPRRSLAAPHTRKVFHSIAPLIEGFYESGTLRDWEYTVSCMCDYHTVISCAFEVPCIQRVFYKLKSAGVIEHSGSTPRLARNFRHGPIRD